MNKGEVGLVNACLGLPWPFGPVPGPSSRVSFASKRSGYPEAGDTILPVE
jgi:hypothetical protein